MGDGHLRLEAWIDRFRRRKPITGPVDARVEALLAQAEPATAVDSGTALVGDLRRKVLVHDEAALDAYIGSDQPEKDSAFLETLVRAPATGCTTLADMARILSGWDALRPEDPDNVGRFYNYIRAIAANPMFRLVQADAVEYTRETDDWTAVINAIADLFEGTGADDKRPIEDSLVQLAVAATSRERGKHLGNLFAQNTLLTDDDRIEYYVCSSRVKLTEERSKSTVTTTRFHILRTRFEFQKDAWNTATAAKVVAQHFRCVPHWLYGFRTKASNPCHRLACIDRLLPA